MTRELTAYEVLQVQETACAEVIEAAWKALMRQVHPDVNPGAGPAAAQALNWAREQLRDPERRARYDAALRQSRMAFAFSTGSSVTLGWWR